MKPATGITFSYMICSLLCGCGFEAMTAERGWKTVPGILERIVPPTFPDKEYRVTAFGAAENGNTDCTEAFREAITACSSEAGGCVIVPAGTYLTGAIHLKSNVNLHLEKDTVISFFTSPEDYLPVVFTRFKYRDLVVKDRL